MGLADGKLAYQKIKPFIATRGCKPLTNPKEVFTVFVNPLTSQTLNLAKRLAPPKYFPKLVMIKK